MNQTHRPPNANFAIAWISLEDRDDTSCRIGFTLDRCRELAAEIDVSMPEFQWAIMDPTGRIIERQAR